MTSLADLINGRRVVASVSGGKDSAAMSLWLTEQGIEHDRVFLDTGWEHEKTYEYLRGPLTDKLGPITEIKPPLLMEDLILKKGMFPSRVRRFCTQELKVKPIMNYLTQLMEAGTDVINAVGIRAGESESRSKMGEWEWQAGFDCEVWRPLIAWSEDQVIAIHARHGLPPNPLYLMGASRVGCWPCIYARKAEIRLIADKDPARIVRLRVLEERVGVAARARAEAKGQTLVSDPAWFQAPLGTSGAAWPIDRVVEWSRTGRGGRQMELFAPQQEEGCVRWGLCETDTGGAK
jgi:3'-phosphoadenosine 5'-phosphosulfate sulfotransferase (PAPS reductase)/FAD synthetase